MDDPTDGNDGVVVPLFSQKADNGPSDTEAAAYLEEVQARAALIEAFKAEAVEDYHDFVSGRFADTLETIDGRFSAQNLVQSAEMISSLATHICEWAGATQNIDNGGMDQMVDRVCSAMQEALSDDFSGTQPLAVDPDVLISDYFALGAPQINANPEERNQIILHLTLSHQAQGDIETWVTHVTSPEKPDFETDYNRGLHIVNAVKEGIHSTMSAEQSPVLGPVSKLSDADLYLALADATGSTGRDDETPQDSIDRLLFDSAKSGQFYQNNVTDSVALVEQTKMAFYHLASDEKFVHDGRFRVALDGVCDAFRTAFSDGYAPGHPEDDTDWTDQQTHESAFSEIAERHFPSSSDTELAEYKFLHSMSENLSVWAANVNDVEGRSAAVYDALNETLGDPIFQNALRRRSQFGVINGDLPDGAPDPE